MTAPRMILPGQMYLITRRCSERRFFLLPTPQATQIVEYTLAVTAPCYGIQVHAYVFNSDHLHLFVTDTEGRLPDFMQKLSSLIARSMNRHLGRNESFWAPGSYNSVMVEDPDDVAEKIAYVLGNPVKDGLVARHDRWPGAVSTLDRLGGFAYRAQRPTVFFAEAGPSPTSAALELTVPACFGGREAYLTRVRSALRELEDAAHAKYAAEGRPFMGEKALLRQNPFASPASPSTSRGWREPRVAARDKRTRTRLLERLATFLSLYRQAWERWKRGERDVEFPLGTWWMRVAHGAPCAICPAPG